MSTSAVTPTAGEQRTIALAHIHTDSAFNPRTISERTRLAQLEDSIRRHGVLQPVLVTPDGDERYRLIAGHRRIAAATTAGLSEIPAIVRPVDDDTRGLDLALVENIARQDLNPVEEAVAFRRLVDAGLTRKGVAQALGVSQKLVTERLALLELPDALHPQIADGTIPPGAIRALVTLAKIHADLPAVAVARVTAGPTHEWDEPLTWTQVAEDPVLAVCSDYEGDEAELPPDIYEPGSTYLVARFTLDDTAKQELAELCELIGCEPDRFTVRLGHEAVEVAEQLGALHRAASGGPWSALISGQDVADRLAADYITACLTVQRDNKRHADQPTAGSPQPGNDQEDQAVAPSEDELKEQRRREREAEQEARRQAVAHNAELGAAGDQAPLAAEGRCARHQVLAAVDVARRARAGSPPRGARYGFPGWVARPVGRRTARRRRTTPDPPTPATKAREFLAGAETGAELAGRCVALSRWRATPTRTPSPASQRSFYQLHVGANGVPWGGEATRPARRDRRRAPTGAPHATRPGGQGAPPPRSRGSGARAPQAPSRCRGAPGSYAGHERERTLRRRRGLRARTRQVHAGALGDQEPTRRTCRKPDVTRAERPDRRYLIGPRRTRGNGHASRGHHPRDACRSPVQHTVPALASTSVAGALFCALTRAGPPLGPGVTRGPHDRAAEPDLTPATLAPAANPR